MKSNKPASTYNYYQLHQNSPSKDYQGMRSRILQIRGLNTSVDERRVSKAHTLGKRLLHNCYMLYKYLIIERQKILSKTKRKEKLETVLMMKKSQEFMVLVSQQK